MARLHVNNYSSTIVSGISDSDLSIEVTSAGNLPTLTGGDTYNLTLDNGSGTIEIVTVTARTGTSLTVTRGAESTTPASFSAGATIELRPTANSIDRKLDIAATDVSGAGFVVDEDNMASNSATKVPTQQSVKAYVDNSVGSSITDGDFSSNGLMVRTASGTYTSRTLTSGDNSQITITNGNGVSSNPTIAFSTNPVFTGNYVTLPRSSVSTNVAGGTRINSSTDKLQINPQGSGWVDVASGTNSGTNTGDQNIFQTIAVSGQSNVVADSTSDTLTLAAGSGITITTDASTDTITITNSGGGGGGISDGDYGDVTVSSSGTVWTVDLPSSITLAATDKVYMFDTSNSNAKGYVTAQAIRDLAPTIAIGGAIVEANSSASQNISTSTFTKLTLDSEVVDTNNNFDPTTNYRFTPTIAGRYIFFGKVSQSTTAATYNITGYIFKNGSNIAADTVAINSSTPSAVQTARPIAITNMNGTTDYIELYTYQDSGGTRSALGNTFVTGATTLKGYLIGS